VECFDDQTIARLMAPGSEPPAGFDQHLDECDACRELVMVIARRTTSAAGESATPEPGRPVGRYVLLDRLGEGGSGVVYRAYDPELQREVAVKLVAPSVDPSHNARLLDEARTMARLAHPNVVRVYDAGTIGDSVFLAMELMSGGTLRDWQRVRRPWSAVLDRYLQAGRGLEAAHERGLVHRDFKPSNVMLSEDGRACVGDFGLASVDMTTLSDGDDVGRQPRIAGTPLYMSPEAHRGETLDGRSDQYSFCVALFEALYGYVPYAGASVGAVERAKMQGDIATGSRRGPRALYRALAQGLRPDPAARFGSMSQLLHALHAVERRRRSIATVVAVSAAALAGALAYGLAVGDREPDCDGAASQIEAVWNADAALALQERAATLELAAARDVVRRASERLDAYARAWSEASLGTCRAMHAGGLTDDAHVRRIACLEQGSAALGSLAHELETLDAEILPTVSDAAASLPPVDRCNDPDASIPITSESVAALRELQAARTVADVGRKQQGLDAIDRIREAARARGDMWVAGEAGMLRCNIATQHQPSHEDVADCEQAAADAVRGDNIGASAVAWAAIFAAEAGNFARPEVGERFALLAEAAAEAADDPAVFAAIASARANALGMQDLPAALEQARLSVKWEMEAHGPDHPLVTRRQLSLVHYLGALERREEALALARETRALVEAAFGPDHPAVPTSWVYESRLLEAAPDTALAVAAGQRALDGFTRLYGPDDDRTLNVRMDVAFLRGTVGDVTEAIAELEAALPKLRGRGPEPDLTMPQNEADYALLLQRAGRSEEAIAVCYSALAAARAIQGDAGAMLIGPHWRCGDIHFYRTELDEALEQWEAALAIAQTYHGPDSTFAVDLGRMIDDARMEWNKPPRRGADDPR
jgi:tetratricopeptide (TPR) repeat protein